MNNGFCKNLAIKLMGFVIFQAIIMIISLIDNVQVDFAAKSTLTLIVYHEGRRQCRHGSNLQNFLVNVFMSRYIT